MKVVFLDRSTLGEDLKLPMPFDAEYILYDLTKREETAERIKDADVIFLNKVKLDEEVLKYAKNLKLICESATGYDNIDVDYCHKNGIAVCNVPGYSTDSVAQITVAMMLSLVSRLLDYREYTASGKYTESGCPNSVSPVFHEMNGMTWGIIGYGNIGKKVGEIAKALGCKVLVYKKTPVDTENCVDIDTLAKASDLISIHIPLCEDTYHLINEERIKMMKKNVVIVNTARGGVTDEEALCKAVKEKKIGGLGSDVYSAEPFSKDSPFYEIKDYPNVCFTPHMAWASYEARVRVYDEMLENMRAFFDGEKRNRVD